MKLSFRNRNLRCFDATFVVDGTSNLVDNSCGARGVTHEVAALDLSHNAISVLIAATQLRFLLRLDVSHNKLHSLHGLPTSLQYLNISHNVVELIDELHALKHLETLDCSDNRIGFIADDILPPKLVTVVATHNRIGSVRPFARLVNLQRLHVDYNALIKPSDVLCLCGMRCLRHLSLRGNVVCRAPQLESLLQSGVEKLATLNGTPISQRRLGPPQKAATTPLQPKSSSEVDLLPFPLRQVRIRVDALRQRVAELRDERQRLKMEQAFLRSQLKQTEGLAQSQEAEARTLQAACGEMKRRCAALEASCHSADAASDAKRHELYERRVSMMR